MLSLRPSSQSLPHLSPISAITWLLPFSATSTSTSFPAFSLLFTSFRENRQLYARNMARSCRMASSAPAVSADLQSEMAPFLSIAIVPC